MEGNKENSNQPVDSKPEFQKVENKPQDTSSQPQLAQQPETQPVVEDNQSVEVKPKKNFRKLFLFLLVFITLGVVLYFGLNYFIKYKNRKILNENIDQSGLEVPIKDDVYSEETEEWKRFEVNMVGLEFELPKEIYSQGEFINEEEVFDANTGQGKTLRVYIDVPEGELSSQLENNGGPIFAVRSSSIDSNEEDYTVFEEYIRGYVKEGDDYYLSYLNNQRISIPKDNYELIKNENGVEILKIRCNKDDVWDELRKPFYAVFDEYYGVINLFGNDLYPSLTFRMLKTDDLDEEVFDKILSSINIEVDYDTSDWKVYKNTLYNYEIKHPSEYTLGSCHYCDDINDVTYVNISPPSKESYGIITLAGLRKLDENEKVDTYLEGMIKSFVHGKIIYKNRFSINGFDVVPVIYENYGVMNKIIYFTNGESGFSININKYGKDDDVKNIFELKNYNFPELIFYSLKLL